MKKHLIAAAVAAAVAVPAAAQNVQIYGILSSAYSEIEQKLSTDAIAANAGNNQAAVAAGNSKVSTNDSGLQGAQAGSRIGFRGTEDLGGGMKAGFVYELGVNNNTGMGANRLGYLQLESGMGTLRAGRVDSLTRSIYNGFTAHGNSGFAPGNMGASMGRLAPLVAFNEDRDGGFQAVAGTAVRVGNANANALGCGGITVSPDTRDQLTNEQASQQNASSAVARANCQLIADNLGYGGTRVANSIGYISPSFNGLSFQVQYGQNDTDRDDRISTNGNETRNFGLFYSKGPLAAAAARDNVALKSEAQHRTTARDGNDPVHTFPLINRSGNELDVTTDMLAISYDFGMAKPMLVHARKTLELGGFAGSRLEGVANNEVATERNVAGSEIKLKETTLGVQIPIGAWQLVASYTDGQLTSTGDPTTNVDAHQLQANYNLSKRTRVYAMFGETETKGAGAALEIQGYAIGVQHSF